MTAHAQQLTSAAIKGSIADVEQALSALPKDALAQDIRDDHGSNALHLAAHHGHTELAEKLMDAYGFHPIKDKDAKGRNPIEVAVIANHPSVLKSLLERQSNSNKDDVNLNALLIDASALGNADVVQVLLNFGADSNASSNGTMSALFLATAMAALKLKTDPPPSPAARPFLSCISLLLRHHADPNTSAPGGFTPLHVAAESGSEELVRLLLGAGASADATTDQGQTPATTAASWGHETIAEILLGAATGDDRSLVELMREVKLKEEEELRQQQQEQGNGTSSSSEDGASIVPKPENPDDAMAEEYKVKGNALFAQGEWGAALEAYQTALRHKTDSSVLWSNAAAAALKLKQYEAALRDARMARSVDRTAVKAWFREGQAADGLELWEDAAAAYFEAYLLQPDGEGGVDFEGMVKRAIQEAKKKAKVEGEAEGA